MANVIWSVQHNQFWKLFKIKNCHLNDVLCARINWNNIPIEVNSFASSSLSNIDPLKSNFRTDNFVINFISLIGLSRKRNHCSEGVWAPKYCGIRKNWFCDASRTSKSGKKRVSGIDSIRFWDTLSTFNCANSILFAPIDAELHISTNWLSWISRTSRFIGRFAIGQYFSWFDPIEKYFRLFGSLKARLFSLFDDKSNVSSDVNDSNASASMLLNKLPDKSKSRLRNQNLLKSNVILKVTIESYVNVQAWKWWKSGASQYC